MDGNGSGEHLLGGEEGPCEQWNGHTILNLEPQDKVITASANAWKKRYQIKDNKCFSMGRDLPGYTITSKGCLAPPVCERFTKLMIFAHGNEDQVHDYDAGGLATYLCQELGFKKAGLIAVRSCEAGKGDLLDDLSAALGEQKAEVGWLIGYRLSASTMGRFLFFGEAREIVSDIDPPRCKLEIYDMFWHMIGTKSSDAYRVKIVPGNASFDMGGKKAKRYSNKKKV